MRTYVIGIFMNGVKVGEMDVRAISYNAASEIAVHLFGSNSRVFETR